MLLLLYLTSILVCLQLVHGQTCTCDFTSNVCDINCCCDTLCTEEERLSFNRCDPINENRIEKVCVSDSVLFSSNGKYQAEGNGAGLFCIFRDNYEARHFYSTVPSVNSLADFEQLLQKYGTTNYAVTPVSLPSYENSFKAGDPLFVLFSNNLQGYISLPTSFTNGKCQDSHEARFQFNNNTQCSRNIQSLQAQCTEEESWSAVTFANGFKVAPYPSFIFGATQILEISNTSVIYINDTRLLEPVITQPLKCKDNVGVVNDCTFTTLPSPTYDAALKTCNNVVFEVHYSVNFTSNGTVELSSVEVSFVFANVQDGLLSFQQKFSTKFQEATVGNITNTTIVDRSGNPGYVIGLPVISGNSFVDFFTEITKIAVNQEQSTWLSTITATSSGMCSTSSPRTSVAFGIDYRSGCFMSVKNTMTLAECKTLQNDVYTLLLTDLPTHIASFGNSNGEQISEWIAVINNNATSQVVVSNGQCGNVITSVLFDILYAKTGFFSNPQLKIVGFHVQYGSASNLVLQCNGITCPSSFNTEIIQTVSFTDVSSTPQTEVKPKPKFKSKAPHDFFYPFL